MWDVENLKAKCKIKRSQKNTLRRHVLCKVLRVTASSRKKITQKNIKARQTRAGAREEERWRLVNSQSPWMNDWVGKCGTGHMGRRGAADALPPPQAPRGSASRNESESAQCHTQPSTLLLHGNSLSKTLWGSRRVWPSPVGLASQIRSIIPFVCS